MERKKYYINICLLQKIFSSGLNHNRDANAGIYGFTQREIKLEGTRSQKLVLKHSKKKFCFLLFSFNNLKFQKRCVKCKRSGANIGCFENSCRRSFHFDCGQKTGAAFIHEGIETYVLCSEHKKENRMKLKVKQNEASSTLQRQNMSLMKECSVVLRRIPLENINSQVHFEKDLL